MSGFYLVHRGSMDHPMFAGEAFSRWQAWAWIIEAASFKPTKVAVGGKWVALERGQFSHSFRFMAKAWRWDEAKVRRFIRRAEKENMIRCVTDAGQCVITVCNYDKYQTVERVADAAPDAPPTQQRRTADANKNEVNQGKEEEEKEDPPVTPLAKPNRQEPRGARLPDTWLPPDWTDDFASKAGLPLDAVNAEADKFRDYWLAAPGARGRKADWDATWRGWIRKAAEYRARAPTARRGHGEALMGGFDELDRRLAIARSTTH